MQRLTLCPHCDAIPASGQARFCGKCGKPLNPQHNSQNAAPHNAPSAPADLSAGYWAGAAPMGVAPPVGAKPPLKGASVASLLAGAAPAPSPAQSTTQPVPAQPSGAPLAVVSPAYDARITPTFKERQRRIQFACVASPIIGVGLGAEPAAILALILTNYGLPPVLVPLSAVASFGALTAYIAHIIMADKVSWISNMISGSMVSNRMTDKKTDKKHDRRTDGRTEQAADKKVESATRVEECPELPGRQR